ncbi:MAG: transporter substrate-binding domain-containing protein [Calditrichaeota bacterium]|nr:transporter substrate-binding domain-containing protein [Calditrichota bacterium]
MKKIALVLLMVLSVSSQKEIQVIFNSENTKLVRFELDLIKDLIDEYGKMKNTNFKIKYKGVKTFKSGFTMLLDSDKDATLVINGISITDERLKTYDFSEPYMINKYSLMSRKDFDFKNDGKTMKVAYQAGSIYEGMMNKIKQIFPCKGVALANTSECVEKLQDRKVDMIFGDFVDSWIFGINVVQHVDESKIDRYGIMYKKGSTLKQDLDKVFDQYKTSAKYKTLLKKHFGSYQKQFFN